MGTTILSFEDRVVIETLHHEKHSLQYIADYLGFSKTTIFNEVHRLAGEYHAVKAQTDHEVKLSHRGRKTILTTNLKRLIEEKIKIQKWSIEQVAHVVRIAYKTIYNWIDQGLLDINVTDLPNHGIRRKRVLRRFIPKGQLIDEITDDELIQINWYLNSRPLKCLNWRTPIEIFLRDLRY
ncbi:helix-turn-helix domain-containing protein [Lactiplantibacillus plantarum]|uniref:helix-turn-helix domain-containing protein n=1 Tax=Lactiplantibacillus plantarum TaxID=1590 RepID=UPI001D062D27|nr:helix-turn-helix domain-containing protein [Lactiplantibacillus plantarum]MCB7177375.1 helix-turn-helix domain-containing protein [Lactiplantibacillus plantarum]